MADFGWAFVKGNLVSSSAPPSGAVQYNDGNNKFAASGDLIFISGSTSQLNLTGNLDVVGDVSASTFYGDGSNLSGITTTPAGADTQIQYNNAGNWGASTNLTFDGSTLNLTGTLNVSGTLAVNELVVNVENRNVINISATGSTQFGDSTDDTHIFTGSMSISASSNPLKLYGIQAGTPPNTSSYLALDSNYNLVLTSAAGQSSGGTIGEAEDGTYTDGLFADFLASTPIGTAIDKFNEILKIIVPGPAPSVDRINYTNTSGVETKLSFETQLQAPTDYVNVGSTGSFTSPPAGPPAIDEQYTAIASGEDYRLGVYNGTQEITGVINFNVSEQLKSTEVNYSHDAFGNAESGSLKLYLNETLLHTLNLDGFAGAGNPNTGSASDLNASGSGFFDVSVSASATDQNGSTYDIFQHRTAKFVIDPNDQNKGWNYAKIEHEYGNVTYVTNFVQWFNDTDASSQAMSVSNPRVTFTGNGSKFLSGVEYFRSASLEYNADVNNAYKYTYPTGNVLTFNRFSNVDPISAQSLPATDGTDLYNKVFRITGSTVTNDDTMLADSTTISINLTHPLKTNLSSTGSVNVDGILIYNMDSSNSNTEENFEIEDYRIISDNYNSQVDVTASSNQWNSENHMTSSGAHGYTDGLIFYDSKLYAPSKAPRSNNGDFASLTNGPSGNPDYSSIITGTRTFYRKIQNTSASDSVYDLKIISTKSTKINSNSLLTDNVKFSVKIPGATGWMVISSNFVYGSISDGHGALIAGASDNSNTGTNDTGDSDHCITFGTASIPPLGYAVIKIEADASWEGYFETLQFQLGASDVSAPTQAPVLDDLDLDDTAGVYAKLSFGVSGSLSDYSNVTGSSIGGNLNDYNINEPYPDDNDDRRGIFKAFEVMGGTLNEDVASNGSNYTANSFFNAYTGSLVLEVNGVEVSTLSLDSSLSSLNNLSSNTGFSLSAVSFSTTTDGIPDYNKPYRTGTYSIGTTLQNKGWNYARVIHRVGASDTTTNYVDWVVDPSGSTAPMSFSNASLSDFGHTDVYYQSGIGYFASRPTASYEFIASEVYSNVYNSSPSAIYSTSTNSAVTSVRISGSGVNTQVVSNTATPLPNLNGNPGCQSADIDVTGSILFNSLTSIKDGLSLFTNYTTTTKFDIVHPLKSRVITTTLSKTNFMVYSGSLGSTNLNTDEHFGLETYRIVSGNYANQSDVTSSSNVWDSSISMNDASSYPEYADGLVTVNGYVISPTKIGDSGNTENVGDGGTLQAPPGNPDYSSVGLSENIRTYYRYFKNNSGTLQASGLTISLYGDATLVPTTDSVGANKNVMVEIKVPYDPSYTGGSDKSTGWCDIAQPLDDQLDPKDDGFGLYINTLDTTIDSGGATNTLNFFSSGIYSNQYFVVKITAHKDWTGYITQVGMVYA